MDMKALCGDLGARINELQQQIGGIFGASTDALRSLEGLRGIYAQVLAARADEAEPFLPPPTGDQEYPDAPPPPMRPPVPRDEYVQPELSAEDN